MRTRFILSFIAALFMQFATVSADNYTDGIMKLMNNDAMASFNTKAFEQMSQMQRKYGKLKTVEISYNTFRGSRNLKERNPHVSEYLFVLEK
jgi:adenine-specific DNA methylase